MPHTLPLKSTERLTHDTVHLVFDRPEGFTFTAGQATGWGIDVDGFRDADHPFTITSLPDEPTLEFVIKTYDTNEYPDHTGLTEAIGKMESGDKAFISDPFGAIKDKGPGVFVAGGAGITPFIPILKKRDQDGALDGCTLIFANKAERDIIMRDTWEAMNGLKAVFPTEEKTEGLPNRRVDAEFLAESTGFDHRFYVCGPPPMMKAVIKALSDNGVPEDRIVVEEGWLD